LSCISLLKKLVFSANALPGTFDVENSLVVVDVRIDGSVVVVVCEVAVTKFHKITTTTSKQNMRLA